MFTKCSRVHIIDISIYYTVPVLVPFVLHLLLGNIDAVCMLILDNTFIRPSSMPYSRSRFSIFQFENDNHDGVCAAYHSYSRGLYHSRMAGWPTTEKRTLSGKQIPLAGCGLGAS